MNRLTLFAILLLAVGLSVGSAAAQKKTIGMVADFDGQVSVFDADSDTILANIRIPGATWDPALMDCAITEHRKLGFVSDFNNNRIWVVDLTQSPATLAAGTNPIPLTMSPIDLSLSPDQKFLVASDGWSTEGSPLAVIDIANRMQIRTFWLGQNTCACAVDVCPDGSVLVAERTTRTTTQIRRLHIDSYGNLTDTNELIADSEAPAVFNLVHVQSDEEANRGEIYGIFVSLRGAQVIGTFKVQGMKMLSTTPFALPWPVDIVVSPRGNRVLVREDETLPAGNPGPGNAIIESFQFHADAGCIGKVKSTIPLERIANLFFGVEQMAIHPNGKKLYVSGLTFPEVRVFDANKGKLLGKIETPSIGPWNWVSGITIVGPQTND